MVSVELAVAGSGGAVDANQTSLCPWLSHRERSALPSDSVVALVLSHLQSRSPQAVTKKTRQANIAWREEETEAESEGPDFRHD